MTPRKGCRVQKKAEDIKLDFFATLLLGNLERVFRTRFWLGGLSSLTGMQLEILRARQLLIR